MDSTESEIAVATRAQPVVAELAPVATAKYQFPGIHPEGRKFAGAAAVLTLVAAFVFDWEVVGWLMAGLTIWVAAFFRDPERVTPLGDDLIVAPADGMICAIAVGPPPRQLLGEGGLDPEPVQRVSIFMNVFDVHINRSPLAGIVRRVVYVPGKFVNADLDKASEDNERQYFVVESAAGVRVGFTQIAGLVARRIVRFVEVGTRLEAGERFGLIRFGSRVDVYLPAGYACQLLAGQRTVAGETVIARRGAPPIVAGTTA